MKKPSQTLSPVVAFGSMMGKLAADLAMPSSAPARGMPFTGAMPQSPAASMPKSMSFMTSVPSTPRLGPLAQLGDSVMPGNAKGMGAMPPEVMPKSGPVSPAIAK